MINIQRLWQHIQELGRIGANEDGSVTRLPFTQEDKSAENLLVQWMKDAHLNVEIDAVGNVIGTMEGIDDTLDPILCGSHYDTVKEGGKFDGCLGVLAGIEVTQTMREQAIQPKRTIKIIGFKDEEGNRFGYGMIGSKSIADIVEEEGFKSVDENGISLKEAMDKMGYTPLEYKRCHLNPHVIYELHIEQAKVLEENNVAIGIVDEIAGFLRYTVQIKGVSAHAGATPMKYRHDPVHVMSDWILHMSEWAKNNTPSVLTVGKITTFPGSCNIICDHVEFSLDIRSIYTEQLQQAMREIENYNSNLEEQYEVHIKMIKEDEISPCLCDPFRQQEIEVICEKASIPYIHVMSGAGHDCMNFKNLCPVTLIFVHSKDGHSHCKEEFSSMEDCGVGTQVLYKIILNEAFM